MVLTTLKQCGKDRKTQRQGKRQRDRETREKIEKQRGREKERQKDRETMLLINIAKIVEQNSFSHLAQH